MKDDNTCHECGRPYEPDEDDECADGSRPAREWTAGRPWNGGVFEASIDECAEYARWVGAANRPLATRRFQV